MRTVTRRHVLFPAVAAGACLGGSDPADQCHVGHEGPLCSVCKEGFYSTSETELCKSCGDTVDSRPVT